MGAFHLMTQVDTNVVLSFLLFEYQEKQNLRTIKEIENRE